MINRFFINYVIQYLDSVIRFQYRVRCMKGIIESQHLDFNAKNHEHHLDAL